MNGRRRPPARRKPSSRRPIVPGRLSLVPEAIALRGARATRSTCMRRRSVRVISTLVITGLCTAYIVWKIDVGKTVDVLRNADLAYFFGAVAIMVVHGLCRWRGAGRSCSRRAGSTTTLGWLLRAYFTALHGRAGAADLDRRRRDARSTRRPGATRARAAPSRGRCCSSGRSAARRRSRSPASASCSRSAATTSAPTSGSSSPSSSRPSSSASSSSRAGSAARSRGRCRCCASCGSRSRCAPSTRAIHAYRGHPWLLVGVTVLTLAIQAVRVLAIWMAAKAVGVDLSPRVVLRDGAAALPRHARPVHDQRAGRARGVLRQLPRPSSA